MNEFYDKIFENIINKSTQHSTTDLMYCSIPSRFFFLSQMVTSMVSLLPASTFSYPISTMLIISSTLEVITFTTITCAVVSRHKHLAISSICLSTILCCRSIAWIACSFLMDITSLQEIFLTISFNNIDIDPVSARIVAVLLAFISLGRDIFTLVMCVKLLKSIKDGGIIHWSYKEQGLYW